MEGTVRRTEIYRGRKAALATMHGKERVIEAPMRTLLGLEIEVEDEDTDALGTFTGEIARPGTMRETAISKARLGMRRTGCPVGLASEGSYGPHPFVPFLPTGTELLVLVDDANGYIIQESLVCEKTNFDHLTATDIGMIEAFLDRVRFPGHALIVQPNQPVEERGARLAAYARRLMQAAAFRRSIAAGPAKSIIYKGVQCEDALKAAFDECARLSQDEQVLVTTDMRAFANPTRMNSICLLADRLAERVACPCPACGAPGYGRVEPKRGLPCAFCGHPTDLVAFEVMGCIACECSEERPRPDGATSAPATYCAWCNP